MYDVAIESPLERAPGLSKRLRNTLLLKREDLQPVFSFKLRGAYNKMANLPPAKLKKGVITASAGNHAQGVALAAKLLGCRATVFMPEGAPIPKVEATKAYGATVRSSTEVVGFTREGVLRSARRNQRRGRRVDVALYSLLAGELEG